MRQINGPSWFLFLNGQSVIPFGKGTTSNHDCYFLYETCLKYKPKKILEIGTYIGKSSYALALGSTCDIYTVDENKDEFIVHKGFEKVADRIYRHPNTNSMDFWNTNMKGFDLVFVDGWLKQKDVENLFDSTSDNFWFLCHDYYPDDKGEVVVHRMLKESMKRNYDYDLSRGGECTALIKFEKENTY